MGNAVLNWEDGIARVVNNRALYARLLGRFVEMQTNTIADMQKALDGGRAEDVRVLAHTVKGTAANLGAEALADAAKQLEFAAKDNADLVAPLAKMTQVLEATLAAMKEFKA